MSLVKLHVVPAWQEHETSAACWCNPIRDDANFFDAGDLWVHRVANDAPHRIDPARDPGPRLGGWDLIEEPA